MLVKEKKNLEFRFLVFQPENPEIPNSKPIVNSPFPAQLQETVQKRDTSFVWENTLTSPSREGRPWTA